MMPMRTLVLALAVLAVPTVVLAQPEDRRVAPTAPSSTSDPCANVIADRPRGPETTWPGFDPRVPAPPGATSFTGIAPPGRDLSRTLGEQPQLPDQAYDACRGRTSR